MSAGGNVLVSTRKIKLINLVKVNVYRILPTKKGVLWEQLKRSQVDAKSLKLDISAIEVNHILIEMEERFSISNSTLSSPGVLKNYDFEE